MLRSYACRTDQLVELGREPLSGKGEPPVWLDLINPTAEEDRLVEQLLDIEIPSRAEMEEIELSARLYQENGAHFMTISALANLDSDDPVKTPVTFILKGATLVTVRFSEPRPFMAYSLRAQRPNAGLSASGEHVMFGILEAMTDRTADALERVGNEVDKLTREVFRNKSSKASKKTRDLQSVIEQIGRKAELLTMVQESLVSIGRLTTYHTARMPKSEAGNEERQLGKLVQRDALSLGEHAKSLTSRLDFLLNATLGLINLEQNGIIKIFSVAAVVFLPPTLVASIYGMNFVHMPELEWLLGYPWALLLMILSAVVPYLFFKRKGWL